MNLEDNWHYFAAFILFKCGITRMEITAADIEAFTRTFGENACTMADTSSGDSVILQLLTDAEVKALLASVNAP